MFDYMILAYGAVGGLVRGAFGIKKAMDTAKELDKPFVFDVAYFGTSVLISAIAGTVAALFLNPTEVTAAVIIPIGFAGIDLVEGLFGKLLPKK